MAKTSSVGQKIKSIRESKNITIEQISERTKLSIEQIKNIEKEDKIASLSPLIKISRVLGVRIGTFLDDCNNLGPVVCKKGEQDKCMSYSCETAASNKYLNFFSLAKSKVGRNMEPFIIDIKPANDNNFILSTHEGEEFIYVLEGEIELIYGKDIYRISAGESIYYDSIVKHNLHLGCCASAKILAVIYTPY